MNDTCRASGILLLDKPRGMTSQDAVNVVRRLYGTRECGHTGTLDPDATGLLAVLVGRAVKASEYAVIKDKIYEAEMTLGIETDTEDATGRILRECGDIPGEDEVVAAVRSFRGDIMQTPPMYSAKKVGGKKLVDIARKGGEVERQPVQVRIERIAAKKKDEKTYLIRAEVSKGTYIRTLCADIGKKLGCGAVMSALRRLSVGGFTINSAYTFGKLEAMTPEERNAALVSVWELFPKLPVIKFPAFYDRLAKNGAEIYEAKTGIGFPVGQRLILADENGRYALAEVRQYPAGAAVKAIKFIR